MGELAPVAQTLSDDLRQFAFSMSGDFRNRKVPSFEVQKKFWLPTAAIARASGELWTPPPRRLWLMFGAERDLSKDKTNPAYIYRLSSTAFRAIEAIPEHVMDEIPSQEDGEKLLKIIAKSSGDTTIESVETLYMASDFDLAQGRVDVAHAYEITVDGYSVYENDDWTTPDGPPWIDETTDADGDEPTEADTAFQAIVDAFNQELENAVNVSLEDTAHRMHTIMDILSSGEDVSRLHDLD